MTTELRAICNLNDEELPARLEELRGGLLSKATNREELPDGLALYFDASPEMRDELEAFLAFERECCPSLGHSFHDVPGALRLEIRGIAPNASLFADVPLNPVGSRSPTRSAEPDTPERPTGWRLLASLGVGTALSFLVFCILPIGIAAVVGAQLAAPLGALDNPWLVGGGGIAVTAFWWRWKRSRQAATATEKCGC